MTKAGLLSLLLCCDGEGNVPSVHALDGQDGPHDVSATLLSLVQDWVDDNTLDGELHPYLDDTLNMLCDFTEALRMIVLHLEDDDPNAADMLAHINGLRGIIHPIMHELNSEDGNAHE